MTQLEDLVGKWRTGSWKKKIDPASIEPNEAFSTAQEFRKYTASQVSGENFHRKNNTQIVLTGLAPIKVNTGGNPSWLPGAFDVEGNLYQFTITDKVSQGNFHPAKLEDAPTAKMHIASFGILGLQQLFEKLTGHEYANIGAKRAVFNNKGHSLEESLELGENVLVYKGSILVPTTKGSSRRVPTSFPGKTQNHDTSLVGSIPVGHLDIEAISDYLTKEGFNINTSSYSLPPPREITTKAAQVAAGSTLFPQSKVYKGATINYVNGAAEQNSAANKSAIEVAKQKESNKLFASDDYFKVIDQTDFDSGKFVRARRQITSIQRLPIRSGDAMIATLDDNPNELYIIHPDAVKDGVVEAIVPTKLGKRPKFEITDATVPFNSEDLKTWPAKNIDPESLSKTMQPLAGINYSLMTNGYFVPQESLSIRSSPFSQGLKFMGVIGKPK